MIIVKETQQLKTIIENHRLNKRSMGFVPTMGALHNGHKSLIECSLATTDVTVCSIFVNPTQFNDPKDFENYPTTLAGDILQLEAAGCHILFVPSVDEMYPTGLHQHHQYDLGRLEQLWEGQHRPGHFQGVCQVMERLLKAVAPDQLFLGQKDYQQVLVIKRLINLLQLHIPVVTVPTLRETSGLAMSSRNMRLTDQQRHAATAIFNNLQLIKSNFNSSAFAHLEQQATTNLLLSGFDRVDYLNIVRASDLAPVQRWDGTDHLLALVAATIGGVRLIDNMMLTAP